MKGRFDSLDTTAMAAWMERTLVGRRVVNIYDGDSGEAYVFKLDGDGRAYFLLESGIRFHALRHFDAGSALPSPFCAKLRKHLRGLRLEGVRQLGRGDRVVLFQFGAGPARHALVLELYARGNLVLADRGFTILALLRSHVYGAPGLERDGGAVPVQVGHVYPVSYATSVAAERDEVPVLDRDELDRVLQQLLERASEGNHAAPGKKKSKKMTMTLKAMLLQQPTLGVSHYGAALIEHCVLSAQLDPNLHIPGPDGDNMEWVDPLRDALIQKGKEVMQVLQDASDVDTPGYILYKPKSGKEASLEAPTPELPHVDKQLEEFVPHLLLQHEAWPYLMYDNFSLAVEDFFAHIGTQKKLIKAQAAELAAAQKLEKIRKDQQDRLEALQHEQELVFRHAKVVQHQAESVEKALIVINSALDSGMDWEQLDSLVEVEKSQDNPIALLIHKLLLESDEIVLALPFDDDASDVEAIDNAGEGVSGDSPHAGNSKPISSGSTILVTLNLKLNAHTNANALFDKYRASKEKATKTIEASSKALAAAEETAKRQLLEAQQRSKQTLTTTKRKPLWFEKFHYFVTTDNYLVLGGKDAHQNELLVKRYLRPGDAYLHADVFGAASCILRAKRIRLANGKTEPVPLPEQALREAGNFTICRSSAWTSRMVTSAWWVEAHQVSKTAPTGEYLTVGSFMVRGKKNFLPPSQLEMGLGVLFRISDDDIDGIARHKNERRDFVLMAMEGADDELRDGIRDVSLDQETSEEAISTRELRDTALVISEENHEPKNRLLVEKAEIAASGEITNQQPCTEDKTLEIAQHKDGSDLVEAVDECDTENFDASPGHDTDENRSKSEPEISMLQMETKGTQKKGLSVRDRKLIRKYGSLENAEKVLGQKAKDETETPAPPKTVNPQSVNQRISRGKKAKLKRALKKYADQDDEDRELAMLALKGGEKKTKKGMGSKKQPQPTIAQLQIAEETVSLLQGDSEKAASFLPETVRTVLAECVSVPNKQESAVVRWDKFDARTIEALANLNEEAQVAAVMRLHSILKTTRIDNFSASLGGIIRRIQKHGHESLNEETVLSAGDRAKRKSKEEKAQEDVRWKQMLNDEGVSGDKDVDENAVDDSIELSKLTGKPHPDDLLLFAVPVCAPYQTLAQYAYKVKLTPGNLKRGKAAKQCLDMLLKQENAKASPGSEQQLILIKKVDDNEWLQSICPDVKISAPGASKLLKQQKAKAKKKK